MDSYVTQTAVQQNTPRNWLPRRGQWSPYRLILMVGASLTAVLILIVPIYLLVRMGSAWTETIETLSKPRTLSVLGNTVKLATAVTLSSA
ncbi:MAG: hypothetical protein GY805_16315, partial [Chloroflexi bacterium]|nr:hypothetical protein [Chloroflexota bacterium]